MRDAPFYDAAKLSDHAGPKAEAELTMYKELREDTIYGLIMARSTVMG